MVPSTTLRYRLENEAACLEYLAGTCIPVPALRGVFQDDGAVYLMTPYIDGIPMSELDPVDKEVVMKELEQHIATLRSLRSKTPGIPGTSIICPHYRLFRGWKPLSVWKWKPKPDIEEYVFCHNDVGQHNVLVDTKSLKIKAIIDWEFSGFFPRWFEAALWKQTGSAPTIGDEDRLRAWLIDNWLPYYWNLLFTHHHRLTAHDLVSGYSGNCFKGFKTFDMAKDYLKRNGCFTFYILEEPADGPKPKSNKRAPRSSYYAVANGRHVGIYSDYK